MKNYFKENILDKNQKEFLESFIKRFLPKRGNKRKNSGNEIDYVGTTIDKIFIQNFGFNLLRQNILDTFENLQYDIFTKNGDCYSKVKDPKLLKQTKLIIRSGDGYSKFMFIYIDIDPSIVRRLMLATFNPPPNTDADKILATEEMKRQIGLFKRSSSFRLDRKVIS